MIVNVDQLQILHNRFRAFLEALRQKIMNDQYNKHPVLL